MADKPWRVMLDTNVFVAGIISRTGASAAILDLGEVEEILIVINQHVLVEIDKVILSKFPKLIGKFRRFVKNVSPLLAHNPPGESVIEACRIINMEDAPILASAKVEEVDYLVTLDKKHFMRNKKVAEYLPAPIVLPSEFLIEYRRSFN